MPSIWKDDESSSAKSRGSTNLSGSMFSTRDYAVDQSVNLMDMGEAPATNLSGSTRDTAGTFAIGVTGLFRAQTGAEMDEYGDAAPSTESEEYISDKSRRLSPFLVQIRSFVGTKAFYSFLLGILGCFLLVGGLLLAFAGGQEKSLKAMLIDSGVTSQSAFDDKGSPQSRALQWLSQSDKAKLNADDKGVLDRYILATLYYSTDGESSWKNRNNWLSEKGICSWNGVQCAPRQVTPTRENGFKDISQSYDDNDVVTGLHLEGNRLGGTLPPEIAGFSELKILDLTDNNIGGTIPTELGAMKKIRDIALRKNSLSGPLPVELTQLSGLHELHLSENNLTGEVTKDISDLVNLRKLSLASNKFVGVLPFVEPLKLLISLHLDDNEFTTTIPGWLSNMVDLKDLRLNKNKLSGTFPDTLRELKNLEVLHLDNNKFQGLVPDIFNYMPRITELQLHQNAFTGTIPETIYFLQALKSLTMDNNKFTGSIRDDIGQLNDVEMVTFHNNALTGTIPSHIGYLDDITTFTLSQNQLHGTIPHEISACFRLQKLTLDQNRFTGSIPSDLGELLKLEDLRLELNGFDGVAVPDEVCSLTVNEKLSYISADCKHKVTCACCTQCL